MVDELRNAARVLADARKASAQEFLLQRATGITVAEASARAEELCGRAIIEAEAGFFIALYDLWNDLENDELYRTIGGNNADPTGGPELEASGLPLACPTCGPDCE